MKRIIFLTIIVFVFSSSVYSLASTPEIKVDFDQNFGFFVGDIAVITYEIILQGSLKISLNDLPQPGKVLSRGLEVRGIKSEFRQKNEENIYRLKIDIQIFRVFKEVKNLVVPEIEFFYGSTENSRQFTGRLPKVIIKVSPLCGKEEPTFQPFFEVKPQSAGLQWFTIGVGALMLCLGLSIFLITVIEKQHHPSCFKRAVKRMKEMAPGKYNEILLIFRRVLSEKAGQAVFAQNLDKFFNILPCVKKQRAEITDLIKLSDDLSFNPKFQLEGNELLNIKPRVFAALKSLARREQWT